MHNTDSDYAAVLANIKTIMTNTSLSESFYEMVLKRLDSFNYIFDVAYDGWLIAFCMQKVESHIMNDCNTSNITDGLIPTAVDLVCGEFFFNKNQSGQLEITGLDLTGSVTSIKEGDTSVSFDTSQTDDQKLDALITYLRKGEGDLVCYRKLHW